MENIIFNVLNDCVLILVSAFLLKLCSEDAHDLIHTNQTGEVIKNFFWMVLTIVGVIAGLVDMTSTLQGSLCQ